MDNQNTASANTMPPVQNQQPLATAVPNPPVQQVAPVSQITTPATLAPQPTAAPQMVVVDASILTELREMRREFREALDANNTATSEALERIANRDSDDIDDDEAVLHTPAAESSAPTKATKPKRQRRNVNSEDDESESEEGDDVTASPKSRSRESGPSSRSGVPKRRAGESKEDYIDRLRKLPSVGPNSRRFGESREVFRARLFDGSEGDEPRPKSKR